MLDGGAYGRDLPDDQQPQEAKNLVSYSNIRRRACAPGPIRSGMYGSAGTYQKTANDEIVLLPMMDQNRDRAWKRSWTSEGIDVYVGLSRSRLLLRARAKLDRTEPEIPDHEKIVI